MTAPTEDLIARLEAEGATRELDREIGLALDGWWTTVDDFGDCLMVGADRYPDHPGAEHPSFTTSVDDALALANRVLDIHRGPINVNICLAGSAQVTIYSPDPCGNDLAQIVAPTPALALCIAILRARSALTGSAQG